MSILSLGVCYDVLADLLDGRRDRLLLLSSGPRHVELLSALRVEVEGAFARKCAPRDRTVATLVGRHVDLTAALAAVLNAYRQNPLVDAADRAAAERVYAMTVAGRAGPSHSPVARVQFGEAAGRLLNQMADDLARLPAPFGPLSVATLLDAWIEQSAAIGRALSDQSRSAPVRSALDVVREATRAFARLRRAVRVDLTLNPDLPANLERLVLGYLDSLAPRRKRRVDAVVITATAEPSVEEVVVPRALAGPQTTGAREAPRSA